MSYIDAAPNERIDGKLIYDIVVEEAASLVKWYPFCDLIAAFVME
jgi:hypothetical protein